MFDLTRNFRFAENLLAGIEACQRAAQLTIATAASPLETRQGQLAQRYRQHYQSGRNVGVLGWGWGDYMVFAFGGFQTENDCLEFVEGSYNGVHWLGSRGDVNATAKRWADSVRPGILDSILPWTKQVYLWGHSFGGVQAHLHARSIRLARPDISVKVCTYGMPRFCGPDYINRDISYEVTHIHNAGDIVAMAMPRSGEAAYFRAFYTMWQRAAWDSQVDMYNGISFNQDGVYSFTSQPQGMPSGWLSGVQDLVRFAIRLQTPHRAEEYRRRLAVAFADVAASAPIERQQNHSPPRLPENVIPPVSVQQAEQAAAMTILDGRATLPEWVRRTPSRVVVRRTAGLYYVLVDGETFYTTNNRLDARGVASSVRNFMRQYTQAPGRYNVRGDFLAMLRGEVFAKDVQDPLAPIFG